jgi:hypothetical protein
LLELGGVIDAPEEGEACMKSATAGHLMADAERHVEPRLVRGHERSLREQGERWRLGDRDGSSRPGTGGKYERCGYGERAEGGLGPARRHRERLEGSLP